MSLAAYKCRECGYCKDADSPHATTSACKACHMPANWEPLYALSESEFGLTWRVTEMIPVGARIHVDFAALTMRPDLGSVNGPAHPPADTDTGSEQ